jgi:hypothetical protein
MPYIESKNDLHLIFLKLEAEIKIRIKSYLYKAVYYARKIIYKKAQGESHLMWKYT